jgi:signal transduction histidine kinase
MKALHLDIDSHVVVQLGAELISDSEQALLELVKNAYDGDATRCRILIDPDWLPDDKHPWQKHLTLHAGESRRVGRIAVEDDGLGLNEDAVTRGWLVISASLKRADGAEKNKTGRNRVPVGDKGLGRLATMRLGDVLFLITQTPGATKARTVSFAWSDFKSGSSLRAVEVKSGVVDRFPSRSHGTNVEVLGLAEPGYWDSETNIAGVISKLSSLISPFKALQDFQVQIRYREEVRDLQALGAEALNHASAKFEFNYTAGRLKCQAWFAKPLFRGRSGQSDRDMYEQLLSDSRLSEALAVFAREPRLKARNFKSLLDEPGGWLFSLEETISWADIPSKPEGAVDPGPFVGEINYILFNEPTKQALQAAHVPVSMLQEMTSIGMFRDGFRVRMDDDWLNISQGVTSGGFFQLRPKNVIGYFAISNEFNAGLVEKSDREGFVDNGAWRGFNLLAVRARKFANDSLDGVRTVYDNYKKAHRAATSGAGAADDLDDNASALRSKAAATESIGVAAQRGAALAKRVSALRTTITSQTGVVKGGSILAELDDIVRGLDDFQTELHSAAAVTSQTLGAAQRALLAHEQVSEHNLRLIDAAAVGLSARGLTHEINSYISQIDKALRSMRQVQKSTPNNKLVAAIDILAGSIRELRKAVASINPLLAGSRSLKDNFLVGTAVNEFFDLRQPRLDDARVTPQITGGGGPEIRFAKVRFNQILENLLQNSLYWMSEHEKSGATPERHIRVECDKFGFIWWDGGKGIREAIENSLFDPYVTDKPSDRGQGLGLFIVTAFLQAEKCSIALLDERNAFGRKYKFRVDLRGAMTR